MAVVTEQYLADLPKIYQDILDVFWMFNPNQRSDRGLASDSIYAMLRDRYTIGEVTEACDLMVSGGAFRLEKEIFCFPTELGTEMIQKRHQKSGRAQVPAFVPPN